MYFFGVGSSECGKKNTITKGNKGKGNNAEIKSKPPLTPVKRGRRNQLKTSYVNGHSCKEDPQPAGINGHVKTGQIIKSSAKHASPGLSSPSERAKTKELKPSSYDKWVQGKFPCKECGMVLESRKQLIDHIQLAHSHLRPCKCSVCGKGFADQYRLKLHMVTHSGERPFTCNICKKGFTQKGSLNTHLILHSGVKAYKCEDCGHRFARCGDLKAHRKIHSEEKRHSCTECGRSPE